MNLPEADPTNSLHNAFVQDWLSRWREKYIGEGPFEGPGDRVDDYDAFESVIELIQETYNYQEHEIHKLAISDHDARNAMKVIHTIAETVKSAPPSNSSGFGASEIYDALELAYAFVNATAHHARETK